MSVSKSLLTKTWLGCARLDKIVRFIHQPFSKWDHRCKVFDSPGWVMIVRDVLYELNRSPNRTIVQFKEVYVCNVNLNVFICWTITPGLVNAC